MRTRHIDFSDSRSHTHSPILGWFIFSLGIASIALCGYVYAKSKSKDGGMVSDREPTRLEAREPAATQSITETVHRTFGNDKRWAKAVHELRLPWVETFTDIEAATRAPVILLSVKPQVAGSTLTLEAETPGYSDMLHYVQTLQKSVTLKDVNIISHQVQAAPPGSTTLRFVVQARWGDNR